MYQRPTVHAYDSPLLEAEMVRKCIAKQKVALAVNNCR